MIMDLRNEKYSEISSYFHGNYFRYECVITKIILFQKSEPACSDFVIDLTMSPKTSSKSPEASFIISSDSDEGSHGRRTNADRRKSSSDAGTDQNEHDTSAEIRTHCDREDGPISIPTDEESETDQGQFKDTDDDLSELSDNKDAKEPKRFSTPIKTKTECNVQTEHLFPLFLYNK